MSFGLDIKATDKASPVLARLLRSLTDRLELHEAIAVIIEEGTREYIMMAAQQRHSTSERLGAAPSGYLTKRAMQTEAKGTADAVMLTVVGAIFRRVFGPVTIKPRESKMLTIPWRAEAYGRKARDFDDLFVYVSKRGQVFLARKEGDRLLFYYLLKASVTLPKDRGLLPSNTQLRSMAEIGARGYFRKIRTAA